MFSLCTISRQNRNAKSVFACLKIQSSCQQTELPDLSEEFSSHLSLFWISFMGHLQRDPARRIRHLGARYTQIMELLLLFLAMWIWKTEVWWSRLQRRKSQKINKQKPQILRKLRIGLWVLQRFCILVSICILNTRCDLAYEKLRVCLLCSSSFTKSFVGHEQEGRIWIQILPAENSRDMKVLLCVCVKDT